MCICRSFWKSVSHECVDGVHLCYAVQGRQDVGSVVVCLSFRMFFSCTSLCLEGIWSVCKLAQNADYCSRCDGQ